MVTSAVPSFDARASMLLPGGSVAAGHQDYRAPRKAECPTGHGFGSCEGKRSRVTPWAEPPEQPLKAACLLAGYDPCRHASGLRFALPLARSSWQAEHNTMRHRPLFGSNRSAEPPHPCGFLLTSRGSPKQVGNGPIAPLQPDSALEPTLLPILQLPMQRGGNQRPGHADQSAGPKAITGCVKAHKAKKLKILTPAPANWKLPHVQVCQGICHKAVATLGRS